VKLSKSQTRLLSEMIANIAVAWFISGIVTPIFTGQNFNIIVLSFITGTSLSLIFSFIALNLIDRVE
jgi:HKD family nuclease